MLMYYVFYVIKIIPIRFISNRRKDVSRNSITQTRMFFFIKCIVIVYNNIIQLLVAKQQDYIGQERVNLSHLGMVYTLLSVARHLVLNLQEDVT